MTVRASCLLSLLSLAVPASGVDVKIRTHEAPMTALPAVNAPLSQPRWPQGLPAPQALPATAAAAPLSAAALRVEVQPSIVSEAAAAPQGRLTAGILAAGTLWDDKNEGSPASLPAPLGQAPAPKALAPSPKRLSIENAKRLLRLEPYLGAAPTPPPAAAKKDAIPLAALNALAASYHGAHRQDAAAGLGAAYAAQIRAGRDVAMAPLEGLLRDPESFVRSRAVGSLAAVVMALVEQDAPAPTAALEAALLDNSWEVRAVAARELGPIQVALIQKGVAASIAALEAAQQAGDPYVRRMAAESLSAVYKAMEQRQQFLIEPAERRKIDSWRSLALPYDAALIDGYFEAPDDAAFIRELKARTGALIEHGFDPANAQERALVLVGLRMRGIDIDKKEFDQRMVALAKFERKHPGYFKSLFAKTRGLPVLQISGQAQRVETESIDLSALDRNYESLLAIERRLSNLEWLDRDFAGSKALNARNLYYQMEKKRALSEGRLRPGERFQVAIPGPGDIASALLSDPRRFYRIAFETARERLGDRALAPKLLVLMRDLVLAEALSDSSLKRDLASGDIEKRLAAIKNLYEDFKNHLPDSVGVKLTAIKGLPEALDAFAQDAREQLAKVRRVSRADQTNAYRLEPLGFLSLFRGRLGIVDCSFDIGQKGTPFARALHEDTIYYGVYKGKEPKGYVGLLVGKTADGRRVLTIDTINSASVDGAQLLESLFRELAALAKRLGLAGLALPQDLSSSFNFDNKLTVAAMPAYQRAKPVTVTPVHAASWGHFTALFGADDYNSIEEGRFRLLEFDYLIRQHPLRQAPGP